VDVAEQGQELLEEAERRRGRWGCVLGVRGLRILRVGAAAALGRVQLHIVGLRVQQLHVGALVLLVGGHPHRRSVECVGQLLRVLECTFQSLKSTLNQHKSDAPWHTCVIRVRTCAGLLPKAHPDTVTSALAPTGGTRRPWAPGGRWSGSSGG
jgi:hypothetical protein